MAMLVRDVMTRDPETVSPETAVLFVARKMKEKSVGCLPVCEGDRTVGLITDRDVVCRGVASTDNLAELKARDIMTAGTVRCFDDEELEAAVRLMAKKRIYHLLVIDRKDRVVGILAFADIALKGTPEIAGVLNALVIDRKDRVVGILAFADIALKGTPEIAGVLNALAGRDAARPRATR
jgi:CBS domain-containing protein